MGWLSSIIKKRPIVDVIRQVAPEEPAAAPAEKQDVVLAYGPDSDAPAAEQLRNLAPVTPIQYYADAESSVKPGAEAPTKDTYSYYRGSLADLGFGQVNPALYGTAVVTDYYNPTSGQWFQTGSPLPTDTVPEGWITARDGNAPVRTEYMPGVSPSTGTGVATMAPASQILAMREGRAFDQAPRQYGYRQPQQMPVRQAPAFRPDTSRLNGDFMDMIRKYADKSMMPALPKF